MLSQRNDLKRNRFLIAIVLAVGLSACATSRPLVPSQTFEPDPAASAPKALRGPRLTVDDRLRHTVNISATTTPYTVAPDAREHSKSNLFDQAHPAIDRFIDYYCEQSPEIIAKSLTRALPHLPMIRETLSQAGVPEEIAYLPIVESHFKPMARSGAGAAGIWQFMRETGRHYGLQIDNCVDERRDPVRSTKAAARYLAALHAQFDDWHLALAAYNIGEGRILRIMKEHDVDDYWSMVDEGLLPRETAQFVPKFLAAATVADNPDTFGLLPDFDEALAADCSTVRIADPISLKAVAAMAGIDRETVQALNPALACNSVPRGYRMRLPTETIDDFRLAYARYDAPPVFAKAGKGRGKGTHRVRRGESPQSIARRYGISVRALMNANRIRNPKRLPVNATLRIPGRI